MKNNTLFPRNNKPSTASEKIRMLCAASVPSGAKSVIDYQDSRLSAIRKDKHTQVVTQNGRNVTIV